MGQIIADVAEDSAAKNGSCGIPVVAENSMRQLPEGACKNQEEGRRHHEAVLVHGQVMVDSVKEEVERDAHAVVRKIPAVLSVDILGCGKGAHTRPDGIGNDAGYIQPESKCRDLGPNTNQAE